MDTGDAVIVAATIHTMRTRVDGTLSVTIEIEPRHAGQWVQAFGTMPGTPVAVAKLDLSAAQAQASKEQTKIMEPEDYGHFYQCLHTKGFFYNPKVKKAFCVPETATAEQAVSCIKSAIYHEAGVSSLKELPPYKFMVVCGLFDVQDCVPKEIREAAQGVAI